ncbi:LysR substrate-binding domain-containing protein [Teichococcus vastitatis]|jgi:DNA-binding transcriptional LysR family regulator|uniref:LysR substrate-binding domain-containing protein n=1 Tax=Teichococcus vastitatis TaxID=2307076 RepID=A0ABS9W382_9PROT|nr:LysR substrate-binding domain-containing protein [Pseudoroseomonas vastitatis]MCI0753747.1 LysR substrate-binding domain-containing protein [Pseudoroseomonas vastitatis]
MTPARLRQLEAFLAVLRAGSVGGAAEILSLSQPAVTKLLRALEDETDLALFDRARRRLRPTPEARRLAVEVEAMFAATRRVDQLASDIRSASTGELRVAALPLLGTRFLPQVLAEFSGREGHPRLSLTVASSHEVVEAVQAGQAELGFSLPLEGLGPLAAAPPFRMPAVLVLPPGHALAGQREVTPRALDGEALIGLGRQYRLRHLVDDLLERHGVSHRMVAETQNTEAACAMARAGLGCAVTDPVSAALSGGAVVRLVPTAVFHVHVLAPPGRARSALAERFLAAVTAALAVHGVRPAAGRRFA